MHIGNAINANEVCSWMLEEMLAGIADDDARYSDADPVVT